MIELNAIETGLLILTASFVSVIVGATLVKIDRQCDQYEKEQRSKM